MNDVPNHDIPSYYVNQAQLHFGVYDFTLEVGRIENPRTAAPGTQPVARLQMSPQHAKVLTLLLLKHIAAYEQQLGIIELPTALLEELKLTSLQHFISQVNLHE